MRDSRKLFMATCSNTDRHEHAFLIRTVDGSLYKWVVTCEEIKGGENER